MMVISMSKLLAPGPLAGICTAIAGIAGAYGWATGATFFGDPALPGQIVTVCGIVGPIVAGFLRSHPKPAVPAA